MARYQYDTIEVEAAMWTNKPKGLEDVLNAHAAQGWRLVHLLSPAIGVMSKYILVFEREVG